MADAPNYALENHPRDTDDPCANLDADTDEEVDLGDGIKDDAKEQTEQAEVGGPTAADAAPSDSGPPVVGGPMAADAGDSGGSNGMPEM